MAPALFCLPDYSTLPTMCHIGLMEVRESPPTQYGKVSVQFMHMLSNHPYKQTAILDLKSLGF